MSLLRPRSQNLIGRVRPTDYVHRPQGAGWLARWVRLACGGLCAAVISSLVFFEDPAIASEPVRYRVDISAPPPIEALIRNNLSLIRWNGVEPVDLDLLRLLFRQGEDEITRLLESEGYYLATIQGQLELDHGTWIVHYAIEPGELALVGVTKIDFSGDITVTGSCQDMEPDALRGQWSLANGQIFRHSDWESAKRKLLRTLLIRCFPLATIASSRAEVDTRNNTVALYLSIDSGPLVHFGPLTTKGLKRFPETAVTNLSPFQTGAVYDQASLLEFQRRLDDTGLFGSSEVSAIVENGATMAPVVVSVEENKAQQVSFGAGYSTDTGYRAQAGYGYLNLLDRAIQLRSNLVLETLKQTLGTDLAFPTTSDGDRDSLSAQAKHEDIQGENNHALQMSAKRAWGPDSDLRDTSFDYIYERTGIQGAGSNTAQTFSAGYGLTVRRTDSIIAPNEGYLLNVQTSAGIRLTDSLPFARGDIRYVEYFPLQGDRTAVIRGEGGMVAGRDTGSLPSELLFRTGGDQSVRGYGYQSLGIRQADAVVGGRYLVVASAELVQWLTPLWPQWGAATFVDAGDAADRLSKIDAAVGYGVGARWRSPVGILNLDVAQGTRNHTTRLHFTLGVAF